MYKQAIRNNYKFQTNVGELTIRELFTASDDTLILLEENLKEEVKKSKKTNRFQKTAVKDKTPKLKLAIVSDIIDTLIEEREQASIELDKKAKKQLILDKLVDAENKKYDDMSVEELKKELDKLD